MLALAALLLALVQAAPAETVVETLPDGGRVEREVVRSGEGEPVASGDYVRYYPSGEVAARGRYAEGRRVGTWETFHPDGSRASVARYRRGLRNGESRSWSEAGHYLGKKVYDAEFLTYDDGSPRFEGEWLVLGRRIRDGVARWFWPSGGVRCEGTFERGLPDGPWTWRWWDGGLQWRGSFERVRVDGEWRSRRTGDWEFRHRDGTLDPRFLSGRYAEGRRTGPLPVDPAPPDLASLGDLAPYPELDAEDGRLIARLLGRLLSGDDARRTEALLDLSAWDDARLPYVLAAMRDAASRSDRDAYRRLRELLPADLAEVRFAESCDGGAADCDAAAAWELRRWWTAWELFAERPEELLALGGAPDATWLEALFGADPGDETERNRPPTARGAVDAEELRWAAALEEGVAGAGAPGPRPPELERALAWLAAAQSADGSWASDLGASALAARALAAGGSTLDSGPHAAELARAVPWLLRELERRPPEPRDVPGPAFSAGVAAVVRAVRGVRDPALRRRIQGPVDRLRTASAAAEPADDPDLGAAALALFAAEDEQFRVLADDTAWADAWVEAGAEEGPGGEELAAVRLAVLLARGADPLGDARVQARVTALLAGAPADRAAAAWLAGTEALSRLGGAPGRAWRAALLRALPASQLRDGPAAGSWPAAPAEGPVGAIRETATAALALALAAELGG